MLIPELQTQNILGVFTVRHYLWRIWLCYHQHWKTGEIAVGGRSEGGGL